MVRREVDGSPEESESSLKPGLYGWVTDYAHTEPVTIKRRPRVLRWLTGGLVAAGVISLIAMIAVTAIAVLKPQLFSPDAAPGAVSPTATPPPSPSPSDPPVVVVDTVLPLECEALFKQRMRAALSRQGLTLATSLSGAEKARPGSADRQLRALMRNHDSLDCYWLDEDGGERAAVLTRALEPGHRVTTKAKARLIALDFTEQRDEHGVRYFIESSSGAEPSGESHYLREGVWFATHWYGVGPRGYTNHMVDNVFD